MIRRIQEVEEEEEEEQDGDTVSLQGGGGERRVTELGKIPWVVKSYKESTDTSLHDF